MSHIGISLSANTASYVQRIKEAKTETDRNVIKMEKRIDQFAQDVNKNFTSVGGSIDAMVGSLRGLKGGGYIAAVAGLGVAAVSVASQMKQLATQTIETQKEIKIAAERSKMSSDEIQRWGIAASTVGISLEKFGDINKDVFDKLGDYVTTGGGPFVDFFDVVGKKSNVTAQELQKLSGPDVLMKVVEEMEAVGASGSQMTWVLESMGNDASNLLPLLKDNARGFKELKERIDDMAMVPAALASATVEIQLMDQAFSGMWNNFGVMMSNEFEGLYRNVATATMKINNFLAGINNQDLVDRYKDMLTEGGGFSISVSDNKEALAIKEKALNELVEAEIKSNYELTRERRKHSVEAARLQQQLDANRAKDGVMFTTEQREATIKALEAAHAEADAITERYRADERKKYAEHFNKLRAVKSLNQFDESNGNATDEQVDKNFKVEKVGDSDAYLKQKTDLTHKLTAAQSQLAVETAKLTKMQEEQRAELAAAPDDTEIKKAWETKLAAQKRAVETSTNIVKTGNKAIAEADKNESDRKQKVVDDAEKLSKEESRKHKEITDRDAAAQMEAAQREVDAAKTTAEKIAAIEKMKLLALEQMQIKYHAGLKQRIKDGSITEIAAKEESANTEKLFESQREVIQKDSAKKLATAKHSEELEKLNIRRQFATTEIEERKVSHDIAIAELERQKAASLVTETQFNDKKAQLERDFEENERTLKMTNFLDSETIEVMNSQIAMERLQEQLSTQAITEEEFAKQRIEIEKRVSDAKRAFATAQLDTLAGTFGQMASMSEEGSARQKTALAAQQAATLASLTMNQWQAWSNIDAPDSPYKNPIAAGIAKTAVIASYAAGLANVGAALGQFHSGSDEVDQTGSYILQSGERVVQRAANKDLTNFLEGNQAASGGATINSDLIIEGDTTIDENRLMAMMGKQREQLAKLLKLAQRENPSLR